MITVRPPITLSGAMPSASIMLGTAASVEIVQEMNAGTGSTFIGQRPDDRDNDFMRNIVMPARREIERVRQNAAALKLIDEFIPVETYDQLREIPACMQLPLVWYTPMRKLLEEGRVDGFGYDPAFLPAENPYARLVENGQVRDLDAIPRDENNDIPVTFVCEHWSDDPQLSYDEVECVEKLYNLVQRVLDETPYDPSNMDAYIA